MHELKPHPRWDMEATWATFQRGTFHTDLAGTELQKCEEDLNRYREIVEMSRPDIVIETGTRAGGSALFFMRELNLQVVSIDLHPQFTRTGKPPYTGPGIEWIRGNSLADWVYTQVLKRIAGKRVMVSLDSDHHTPHVIDEITRFAPLVSPGCYLVVEDACFDLFHRAGKHDWARVGGARIPELGGPLFAMEHSMELQNPRWHRDLDLEGRSPVSHSPMGWWRRVG